MTLLGLIRTHWIKDSISLHRLIRHHLVKSGTNRPIKLVEICL